MSSESDTKLLLILNCDSSLINGISSKVTHALRFRIESLVASTNIDDFGINLIGTKQQILKVLKSLILEENTSILSPFLDHKEKFFAFVDKWNHTQISGKILVFNLTKCYEMNSRRNIEEYSMNS